MKKESIEFQLISEGKKSSTLVRQIFRVPISDNESVHILIKQKKYLVSNISQGGIGISPDSQLNLEADEILVDCELILANTSISGLTGKVIHCSFSEFGPLQYGVQWLELQTGQSQSLDDILSQMKARALEDNDRNIS
ncbi:MAG: PilZ domain-containing protein [Desulfobacteraceae bacterium]|nr:PilZ domain-containing protein [Desulfobacteraceae bacterium]